MLHGRSFSHTNVGRQYYAFKHTHEITRTHAGRHAMCCSYCRPRGYCHQQLLWFVNPPFQRMTGLQVPQQQYQELLRRCPDIPLVSCSQIFLATNLHRMPNAELEPLSTVPLASLKLSALFRFSVSRKPASLDKRESR